MADTVGEVGILRYHASARLSSESLLRLLARGLGTTASCAARISCMKVPDGTRSLGKLEAATTGLVILQGRKKGSYGSFGSSFRRCRTQMGTPLESVFLNLLHTGRVATAGGQCGESAQKLMGK